MKYILGIDTTFHSCCVGIVNDKGKVLLNEKVDIDFSDQNAKKFFNFHNRNILSLVRPILREHKDKISLISASCEDGPFHAMPVGAIVANTASYLFEKNVVGVSHEIAHMHANWLDRDEKDFSFPVISLNVSGAHSNVFLISSLFEIKKVSEFFWRDDPDRFSGLGALFEDICDLLSIKTEKGKGGIYFEKLANSGIPKYKKELEKFSFQRINAGYRLGDTELNLLRTLKNLKSRCLEEDGLENFQKNVCASLSEILYDSLVNAVGKIAEEVGAKEIHLAGGVALDKALNSRLAVYCKKTGLKFKFPLKPEYCRDNAAMIAISGYFKWKYSNRERDVDFLTIEPAEWYIKYYVKRISK
jgi:N6-L-threonylcarbamoyladenine synthase